MDRKELERRNVRLNRALRAMKAKERRREAAEKERDEVANVDWVMKEMGA